MFALITTARLHRLPFYRILTTRTLADLKAAKAAIYHARKIPVREFPQSGMPVLLDSQTILQFFNH